MEVVILEGILQWCFKLINCRRTRAYYLSFILALSPSARMVCESLINSDTLEWERTQLWALTFKLVRKIIGGVDYKVSSTHSFLCAITRYFLALFLWFMLETSSVSKSALIMKEKNNSVWPLLMLSHSWALP